MPRSASTGVYTAPSNTFNPAVSDTVISSTAWNATQADYVTALGHTASTTRALYPTTGQVQDGGFLWGGTAGGTADALTITLTPAITAYAAGLTVRFIAPSTNTTTTPTLAINGLTGAVIKYLDGPALIAGEIVAGTVLECIYDGSAWRLSKSAYVASTSRARYSLTSQVQDSAFLWGGTAGGTADALTINLAPAITAYVAGLKVLFIATSANTTTTPTLAVNGLTAVVIKYMDGPALIAGEIVAGTVMECIYDGSAWRLSKFTHVASTTRTRYPLTGQVQDGSFSWGGTAGGTSDALTLTLAPAITAYVAGLTVRFIAAATNTTTAPTLSVNGLSAVTIKRADGGSLAISDITNGSIVEFVYDGVNWKFLSLTLGSTATKIVRLPRTSNTIITAANSSNWIDITSGTFTQTFETAANLGVSFACYVSNNGAGEITITSDSVSNWIMWPGDFRLFQSDGTTLRSISLHGSRAVLTTSRTILAPPGIRMMDALIVGATGGGGGGGGGGGAYLGRSAGAGGAGAHGGFGRVKRLVRSLTSGESLVASIGAAGTGGALGAAGATANSSGANGTDGTAGGTTSFDGVTADGGVGGPGANGGNQYSSGSYGGVSYPAVAAADVFTTGTNRNAFAPIALVGVAGGAGADGNPGNAAGGVPVAASTLTLDVGITQTPGIGGAGGLSTTTPPGAAGTAGANGVNGIVIVRFIA